MYGSKSRVTEYFAICFLMLWQYWHRSPLTAAVTRSWQCYGMPAVTNPGGGILFWGLLSASPYSPKLFGFWLLSMGVWMCPHCPGQGNLGQLYLSKELAILRTSAWRWFCGHTGDWDNTGSHPCHKLSLWIQGSSFRSGCPPCPVWRRDNRRVAHTLFFCPAILGWRLWGQEASSCHLARG